MKIFHAGYNNIEHILHLPCTSDAYFPPLLSSRFFTICDIHKHSKLVLHMRRVLLQLEIMKAQSRAHVYSIDKHPPHMQD